VRRQGLVDSPGGIGLDGHACWAYDDLAGDFVDAAVPFLAEGLDLGQALMFVGGPEAEEVVRSVDPLADMVRDGTLQVEPFETVYPGSRRLPDGEQWAAFVQAVTNARAAGFTGLRALAEVTCLAGPEDASRAHAQWETYADRRMAGSRLAALCCFDRAALPPEGLAAIACAHPVVDHRLASQAPFRLFGRADALALAGEVDAFCSETLRHLLRTQDDRPAPVLDLDELTFIEHTGVAALHEYAERVRAQGARLEVRGGPSTLRRLSRLLGVSV
jgi:ABC-type transporter Mla MlaB component